PAGRHRGAGDQGSVSVLWHRLPHLPCAGDHFVICAGRDRALGRQDGAGAMTDTAHQTMDAIERPPPPARVWSRERIAGHVLMAFWAALCLGIAVFLVTAWDGELFARYAPAYASGLWV